MEKQGFVRFNYDLSFATMHERKVIEIGCGEWGFRNLPMREHFENTSDPVLEFPRRAARG